MKPIFVKFIFDRKKRASARREGTVELRLTQNRRTLYFNTGIKVLPKHWHNGQVVHRVDAAEIQQALDLIIRMARQAINTLTEEGICTIEAVMERMRAHDEEKISFISFCYQRAEIRCYGKSVDSKDRYERFLKFFDKFGKIQKFSDITDENIMEMDKTLKQAGMKNYSKWNNYHRFLNSFILDAIDAGYIQRNPYRWLRIDKDKSKGGIGKYLTMEEFERIKTLNPPTESLQHVRDLFVFQTYTCLSYTDMASFDANCISVKNGRHIYTANRGKTHQEFTFLILSPAMEILRRYGNRLPIISNVKYNEYLKVLALMAGINKPVSSHWARHTGATMLLNKGIEMEIVAKVLGHSSTRITRQVYAKLLDDTVADAMSRLEKKGSVD